MEHIISIDRVVDRFLALAGEASAAEGRIFCRTAAETVESWVDRSRLTEAYGEGLDYAAATVAFYRFTLKNSGNAQSVKAGDITVTDLSDRSVEFAKSLMQDALKAVEHLFKPKRFAFMKTEVV